MNYTTGGVMNKNMIIRFMFAVFALAMMCDGNAAAEAELIAMVTDLTGKAAVLEKSGKRSIFILYEIKPNTKIQLNDKSHMVIVYIKSGQEYEISGPSKVQFNFTQPDSIGGNKPSKRNALLWSGGNGIRVRPGMLAQAAIVMRGTETTVKLLNLVETLTLEAQPEFHWGPAYPGLNYRFTLKNDAGKVLLETVMEGTSYKLPASITLDDNQVYRWEITSLPPVGARHSASGDFGVASSDLRKMAKDVRPQDTAPLSERVAFAIWLDQMKLKDEAHKYWKAAATETMFTIGSYGC
jgi:hypothetical protein